MKSIASIINAPEFQACTIHWKGVEFSFWCKVLSSKEHREVTNNFGKDGALDLSKYREQTDAFIARCVYVPATEMADSKRPVVEFTDDDGESHEVIQWVTRPEASELKAALADKIKVEIETVNRLKVGTEQDEDLGKE